LLSLLSFLFLFSSSSPPFLLCLSCSIQYYTHIAPPAAIKFEAIPGFTTASRDPTLARVAASTPDVDFVASSSSTTGVLSQVTCLCADE
jgi:hypothetical protein